MAAGIDPHRAGAARRPAVGKVTALDEPSADALNQEIIALLRKARELSSRYKSLNGSWPEALFSGRPAMPSPQLLEGCRVVASRMDILRRLPRGGRFAEIGTFRGDFARKIIDIVQPDELHLFDVSFSNVPPSNLAELTPAVTRWHQGLSWETLGAMPQDYFDVVYIDADHSYEAVSKDLDAALRATRPGGRIICNDYTVWSQLECKPYGVYWAVNEFATRHALPFEFLALQPNGYHDVGLLARKVAPPSVAASG